MTSVPKPLKFLRPHYDTLKQVYEKINDDKTKVGSCLVIRLKLLEIYHGQFARKALEVTV